MRLLNHLPHPVYFLISGFAGFCFSIFLAIGTFREQISQYYPLLWSPDGSKLAFVAEEDNGDYELFVIDSRGSDVVQLTTQIGAYMVLRWSEDSEWIYYQIAPIRSDNMTWYRASTNLEELSIEGSSGIDPYQNPIATEAEIEASLITSSDSDDYYAISTCNDPRFYGDYRPPIDECEKTLEVYSVETDRLAWSFGKCQYDEVRYGRPCFIDSFRLLPVSIITIVVGFLVAIMRVFKRPDTRKPKSKSDI